MTLTNTLLLVIAVAVWFIAFKLEHLETRLMRMERLLRENDAAPLLLLVLVLGGCSLPTMTRGDMTAFDRDHYECYREASFPQSSALAMPLAGGGFIASGGSGISVPEHTRPGQNLYRLCMKARGYREAD